LFEKKLVLTIQVRDIFSTAKFESTTNGVGYYSFNRFERESPIVMLNIRYNFNNFKQERNTERPNGEFEGGEEF